MAAIAERAAARAFGIDLGVLSVGPDLGYDFEVDGVRFDAKFTRYPNGRLIFKTFDSFKADAAVLVRSSTEPLTVEIVGCIGKLRWSKLVYAWSTKAERVAWAVNAEQLTPFPVLLSWFENRRSGN